MIIRAPCPYMMVHKDILCSGLSFEAIGFYVFYMNCDICLPQYADETSEKILNELLNAGFCNKDGKVFILLDEKIKDQS